MSRRHGPGTLFSERSFKRTRPTKVLLRMLWHYIGRFWSYLLISAISILVYTIGSIIYPLIISRGLDMAIPIGSAIPPNTNSLIMIFVIFLVISFIIWFLNAVNTYVLSHVRAYMLHDVRKDVFNRLVKADMSFHKKEQSGDITSRVVSDTDELSQGISVVTQASSELLLTFGTFFILLATNVIITGISLLAIPVAAFLAGFLGNIGRKIMYRVRKSYGAVTGQMAESLAGVSIAKSFNREEWSSGVLYELNLQTYKYFKQMGALFNFLMPSVSMISTILVSLTLLVGGSLHPSVLTFGQIYLGVNMVQRFLSPILHISMFYPQLQSSLAAMDRIADVLEQQDKIKNSEKAVPLTLDNTSVTFDKVSFEYILDTPVLSNVTFKVEQGEKIAIVGHTGAGKTTLAALIARFYDPTSGNIFIGNQNLKDITLESLHTSIGLIPQEPYLFADTVIENIRYGNPDVSDGEIFELCKLIGAEDFIDALPDGYNTHLLESGKGLSSGQRQMITIARTMLADPKILVLDEATSRLDAYSESLVQLAQRALFKGRTTFVIAHRLTTIRDVDRIAVFEKGKLVELGTHKELLDQRGVYSELYYTYYSHQGIEEISEAHMAPREDLTDESPLAVTANGNSFPEGMKGNMADISPTDLAKMKERISKLSPEEREQMKRRFHP